jgi:acyl-CoA thioester hydrolase
VEARHLPVVLEIPVAWAEQDMFGHLNNVVFFRYCENVRMHFLELTGLLSRHNDLQQGVILASTTCNFKKPVKWPQQITIRTGCTAIGNTSFTLVYVLTDESGDVVAEATSVQVMYDYQRASKMPIPDVVREAIADVQGR